MTNIKGAQKFVKLTQELGVSFTGLIKFEEDSFFISELNKTDQDQGLTNTEMVLVMAKKLTE